MLCYTYWNMITIEFEDFNCGCININFYDDDRKFWTCDYSLCVNDFTTITDFLKECINHNYADVILGEEGLSTKLILQTDSSHTTKLSFMYEDGTEQITFVIIKKQFIHEFYTKLMKVLEKELVNISEKKSYYMQNRQKDYDECKSAEIEAYIS